MFYLLVVLTHSLVAPQAKAAIPPAPFQRKGEKEVFFVEFPEGHRDDVAPKTGAKTPHAGQTTDFCTFTCKDSVDQYLKEVPVSTYYWYLPADMLAFGQAFEMVFRMARIRACLCIHQM
jgi:hypothetical protein